MTGHPDPKPLKRHKADVDEWKILRKLKLGPCRVCGNAEWTAGERPGRFIRHRIWVRSELHHLVGRDLGGDDLPENLVPLCRDCHPLVEERSIVACELLREALTPKELAYVLHKKGVDFLNRYYPRRSAENVQSTMETAASS